MLPTLQRVPKTPQEWQTWAWEHRDSHNRIRAAILTQKGKALTDWVIEPVRPAAVGAFLQNNANLHTDMNKALGAESDNLLDADWSTAEGLTEWIRQHFLEHQNAEQALKI